MNPLYHLGIWLYRLIAILISPFHTKAALFSKGHKGLISKIQQEVKHDSPIVWFHCASLGEFEQGYPIIEGYRRIQPDHKIVVTFFSPSGYEVLKGKSIADWVFYLPLDTNRNARLFLDAVLPIKAIFIKYEFWTNYLKALKMREIPTFVVSASFRYSQPFFKWYGSYFRLMLKMFTRLFVQEKTSELLLNQIGVSNVVVAGDTRFDRVWKNAQKECSLHIVELFCSNSVSFGGMVDVCVAGSTWPRDESLLCKALGSLKNLKMILAPHEVDSNHIDLIMEQFASFTPMRFSQITHPSMVLKKSRVLVVDTIGTLSSLYRFGSMAYVGGGFDNGIHNTLEAAVYGIPVVFGPRYKKFNEAVDLVRQGGAFSIRSSQEMITQLNLWLSNRDQQTIAGQVCARYVQNHTGATEKVLNSIMEDSVVVTS